MKHTKNRGLTSQHKLILKSVYNSYKELVPIFHKIKVDEVWNYMTFDTYLDLCSCGDYDNLEVDSKCYIHTLINGLK